MKLQDLIDLSERLTYQGKSCMKVYTDKNWRALDEALPEGYIYISVWVWANDVEKDSFSGRHGIKIKVEMGGLCSVKELERTDIDSQISHVKDTLTMLAMHEIHETLMLDGNNIFNPHKLAALSGFKVTREEMQEAA